MRPGKLHSSPTWHECHVYRTTPDKSGLAQAAPFMRRCWLAGRFIRPAASHHAHWPDSNMPAINPTRLKQQTALLAESFNDPPAYVARPATTCFDLYAERARRPGQSGMPAPLIDAYKVHPPILPPYPARYHSTGCAKA